MRGYNDYMDNIAVDMALHEKIMRRITQQSAPRYLNRNIFRFAGIAACAAVLLLCVRIFNNGILPGNPPGNEQPGYIPATDTPATDSPVIDSPAASLPATDLPAAALPAVEPPITDTATGAPKLPQYPLTLNKADSQLAARIVIPGHFWYELTDEQITAVLPDFAFPLNASVHYRGDGTIFNVAVYETDENGEVKRFNNWHTMTEIVFAPGKIIEDVIYEYEPQTSNVNGVPVTAGVFDWNEDDGVALYIASFKIEDIAYNIKLHDAETGDNGPARLTEIVNAVIINGAPDLTVLSDPVIPELRDETLTLEQARTEPDFGAYLPDNIPSRFNFETAKRFINQISNYLYVSWSAGYGYIQLRVSEPTEYDRERIVYANEREKYDLSLYPIPYSDSVPEEFREYVDNPVFPADELSLEVIKMRAYQIEDRGDTPGWRMNFSVMYDDVIVNIYAKGISPEEIWEIFAAK